MMLTNVVITDTLAWKEINEHDSRYADRSHEVGSSPKTKIMAYYSALWHTAKVPVLDYNSGTMVLSHHDI